MLFNKEKKRQVILENYQNPTHEVPLIKLQEISDSLKVPFYIFRSLNAGCGDTVNLLIRKKNNSIELALFASEQQACCLTVAATNILCCWMKNKEVELVKIEINEMEKMLQGQNYQLNNCSQMEVFGDLSQFPQRIECVGLVLKGVKKCLNLLYDRNVITVKN